MQQNSSVDEHNDDGGDHAVVKHLTADDGDQTVVLTRSASSWITIERIPEELAAYATEHFSELFELHPAERGVVMSLEREIATHRWHKSYLQTPSRCDGGDCGSYMFSGRDETNIADPLPELLIPFFAHMNGAAAASASYNQVVANWYRDGSDYIAFHSDYTHNLTSGSDIAIISLDDGEPRTFTLKVRHDCADSLYDAIELKLQHGCVIRMCGNTQAEFRHGVRKDTTGALAPVRPDVPGMAQAPPVALAEPGASRPGSNQRRRRISLTFRSYTASGAIDELIS